jgi:hypothetical protein
MNYVWDCLQHTFKRKEFDIIRYLDVKSLDEVYNSILYIIDEEFSERIN